MKALALTLVLAATPAAGGEIDALVAELARPENERREAAVRALSAKGPTALRQMIAAAVPIVSATILAPEGTPEHEASQRLQEGLVLAAVGFGPGAAVPLAESALADMSGFENEVAGKALVRLGPSAKAAVPVLVRGLHSRAYDPPRLAPPILTAVDRPGWPSLVEALGSPEESARHHAAEQLRQLAESADEPERAAARKAWLGPLGPQAPPATRRVSGRGPAPLGKPAAVMPDSARQAGVKGTVLVDALIDTRGRVVATHVLRSIPLLDVAAIEAVRRYRYEPVLESGRAVPVLVTVPVAFELP